MKFLISKFVTNFYHELFFTPGILPSFASSLKQMRQSPKLLIYPLPRPHLKQRFFALVENLGFLAARAFTDVFAIQTKKSLKDRLILAKKVFYVNARMGHVC
jgi:hypothetical protein